LIEEACELATSAAIRPKEKDNFFKSQCSIGIIREKARGKAVHNPYWRE
jgi:hypothetical protein